MESRVDAARPGIRLASVRIAEFRVTSARLIPVLRRNAPHATVVQGDALHVVRELPCDILIGSLPGEVTAGLLEILPSLDVRVAMLAVASGADLSTLEGTHRVTELALLSGADYVPAQPSVSRLVQVEPRRAE